MRIASSSLAAILSCFVAGTALAAIGGLDPSFGTGGKVTTAIGGADDLGQALVQQTDGKLVVAGAASNGSDADFALVRYNSNGTLDGSFGTGGKVTTAIGSSDDVADALVQQTDGKLVAAGYSWNGSNFDLALARYNTNGTLDGSFGTGGKVTTVVGASDTFGFALVQQADGKLVVAGGGSATAGDSDFLLVRYNTNGTPDGTFGSGGVVTTAIGGLLDAAFALVVQPDGMLVAGGYTQTGSQDDFALVRYTTSGVPDSGFGTGGKVTTSIGTSDAEVQALLRQSDGMLVAAGRAKSGGNDQFGLVRYTTSGAPDSGFGTGGKVTTQVDVDSFAFAIVQQADGKLVAGGAAAPNPSNQNFGLARYQTNGNLDAVFGTGGKVSSPIGSGNDVAHAMIVQPDGLLVLAGNASNGSDSDFAVARYVHDCVDTDNDGQCADEDNCPDVFNPGQEDHDFDGIGTVCDICTGSTPAVKHKIIIGKLLAPTGDDKLTVKGDVTFPHPYAPAIDVVNQGFRVLVGNFSQILLDNVIPGGAYDPVTKIGWKVNKTIPVSKWTYVNQTAAPGTVYKVTITDKSIKTPGLLHIVVNAKNGDFTSYPAAAPLAAILAVDVPAATTGQCGTLVFPTSPGHGCAFNSSGVVFVCK